MANSERKVVVVDYGLGNLFSVERALRYVGAGVEVTDEPMRIQEADYLILPGVGAFGDGMEWLHKKNLIEPLHLFLEKERPLLGICLGMQLLFTESEEFGIHKGLNIVPGRVVRLSDSGGAIKIPHIGWNSLLPPRHVRKSDGSQLDSHSYWKNTMLEATKAGMFVYFVHSYMVVPDDPAHVLAETEYGGNVFCSVVRKNNIYACQFHPERSGDVGLAIYRKLLTL